MLHFQRRASAADCHHLYGILSYDKYAGLAGSVEPDRQKILLVFKKNDSLVANTASGFVVFVAAQAAVTFFIIHCSAENQTKHTAAFFVKLIGADFAFFYKFKIRTGHVIIVVSVGSAH